MMSAPLLSSGPEAAAWASLGAIKHVLRRSRDSNVEELVGVDRDRLADLSDILREVQKPLLPEQRIERLGNIMPDGPVAMEQVDAIALAIRESPTLHAWKPKQKLGPERKVERLSAALDSFRKTLEEPKLTKPKPPEEEFQLLEDLLDELVRVKAPYVGQ